MKNSRNYKKRQQRNKSHRQRKKMLSFFCTIVLLAVALFYYRDALTEKFISYTDKAPAGTTLTVNFLDVGQGNCVLAESDGHYILIDGGDRNASSFLVSYLQKLNISYLDYIIISHYDADHLNGIVGVLHQFDIGTIIAPDYKADTKIYQSYENIIKQKSYTPIHPNVGDTFYFGDSAFQIVCPTKYTYSDENNNSIGIRLTDSHHSFLILGDAQSESENVMLKSSIALDSDVYMVSHHGSSHSSSDKFLDAVKPSFAVISVGTDNDYGHPTEKVLNRLLAHNTTVFRTDYNGTITAYSGKDFLSWKLEKNN